MKKGVLLSVERHGHDGRGTKIVYIFGCCFDVKRMGGLLPRAWRGAMRGKASLQSTFDSFVIDKGFGGRRGAFTE